MKRLGSLVQEGSGLQSQPSDASAGVPPAAKARRRSRSSGASASTRCDSLPSEGSGLASSLPRASSGSRKRVVRRVVKVRKVKKRTGASSSNGGGGGGCPPAGGISIGDMVVIGDVLRSIDAYDSKLQKAAGVAELDTSNSGVLDLNAIPSLSPEEQDALVTVFDHMLAGFDAPRYRSRYGHCSDDDDEPMLHFGQDVPSYFANVVDQSIHRRKVLSMAGMRNLVAEGRRIYEDLAARKFASDPELYCGDVGVNRMRRVTGNTVDLDTCVLRASDRCTMRAINAANEKQGLPTWDCYTEFSMSDQAYQIANAATLALTEQFVKDMKMTDEEARRRKVHASQIEMPVPMATHNTQRGKWPVWHYTNCGVDSFHANVPNMHDVNGALLRAPMHCVKGYLHVHQLAAAHGSEEARAEALQKYLDRFFEDAVADSCFNMKWKAVEEFNEQLAHERTIVHLLQVTQADHQALFSAIMDDDDDDLTRERAEMWRLVEGAEAYSTRDAKVRTVTKPDVDAWVADPSVSL